jgi:aminoglycoside phosphotransferase (APT) family kinase protein
VIEGHWLAHWRGFLAVLHSISTDETKRLGAPADTLERLNSTKRRPATRVRLDAITAAGIRCDIARIEHLLDTLPVIERPRTDTLVHGDLHSGQIVVNEQHQIAGIIDWGDVHVGDPAVDLGGVQAMLPHDCQDEFLQEYGQVDDVVWAAARGRLLCLHTVSMPEMPQGLLKRCRAWSGLLSEANSTTPKSWSHGFEISPPRPLAVAKI